ncbi:MAG TPA: Rieske 2Fe-2S domain-containing protein [Sphingomonas sp.]
MTIDPARWYPVAASGDLPYGHVYQTMLGGHPLAIWRAADGRVNIWEDRCPHRGVRFSIGIVRDDELRCQYHAWRFASGTGACTHIPAQPAARPAAAIRATVWPVAEMDGLVWTGLTPEGQPEALGAGDALRPMPVGRDAATVAAAVADVAGGRFVVQPVDAGRSVIRGVAPGAMLRAVDAALEALRHRIESVSC